MKTSKRMLCLGIHLLAIGGAVRPASAQEPTSEFTTTDPAKVKVMEHFTREKDGVMDSFRHLCPGLGGYQVIHEGGDDRSWINLRFGGKLTDLYAATMAACPGHFPVKLNNVVQWRGIRKDGKFVPYAVIYRMLSDADPDADNPKAHFETLIVIKLDKENSRVVGKASGAKANDDAERLADRLAR